MLIDQKLMSFLKITRNTQAADSAALTSDSHDRSHRYMYGSDDARDLAARIGRWAVDFQPSHLQLERARISVRDFAGCVVAGTRQKELQAALQMSSGGQARVWGLERGFDAASAALVTGTAGSLLQLHDVYVPGGLHPSSSVISAAWAAWCVRPNVHSNFTQAIAAGYEVCNRIGIACAPGQALAGSSSTATAGAIGAAVAAGLVSGLDAEGIGRAISNAALLLPATPTACMRSHGALTPLHGGIAARAGVEGATLARFGTAGQRVLEGDAAMPGLISFLRGDTDAIAPGAWNGATIEDVAWKFFPACFASQTAIEAALRIAPRHAGAIERAIVHIPDRMLWLIEPGTGKDHLYDRLMSVRWAVARALERGAFDWTDANTDGAATQALASRIEVVHAAALDRLPAGTHGANVEVHTSTEVVRIDYRRSMSSGPSQAGPIGWTSRPDDPALAQKFSALTGGCERIAGEIEALLG